MVRRFASLVAMIALGALASAAEFGRFGYREVPDIPGWELNPEGIRPKFPRSDRIFFDRPYQRLATRSIRAHESDFAFLGGGGLGPSRLRVNLYAAGPELMFERGFRLRFGTLAAPLLSWSEGSVGPGVPAPPVRWVAVSFQDSQPPVLLTFLDAPTSVVIHGRPGDWTLDVSAGEYRRWVRFALPLGIQALTTTDAAALGLMVQRIREHEAFWTGPSPRMERVRVEAEQDAVVGIWQMSGPHAVVPTAAFLARRGGFDVQIASPIREINAPTDEGPTAYTSESEIRIRFPVLGLPRGRSLTAGPPLNPIPRPNPSLPFSIANAGFSALLASRPQELTGQLRGVLEDYLERAPFAAEPNTGAQMPFGPNGIGASEAGFYSLLQQALAAGEGLNQRPSSLLTSLIWARDTLTWQIPMIEDSRLRRRTGALASVAAALSADPMTRLEGALFHAGLAGERGLSAWRGTTPAPTFLEPMDAFRQRLFKPVEGSDRREPMLPMLVNPVRLLIGPPMTANNAPEGRGYIVRWNATRPAVQRLVFQAPFQLGFRSETESAQVLWAMAAPDRYEVRLVVSRPGSVAMRIDADSSFRLPPTAEFLYTETVR